MSDVHGAKAVVSQMKSAASPMMGSTGAMMHEGMGSMMKMAEVMSPGVVKGAVACASSSAGKSGVKKILTHPLVLFGLGVVVGCYVYKYRKSIISSSEEAQQE